MPVNHRVPHRITTIKTLAQHGMSLQDAHAMMGDLLRDCRVTADLPDVLDLQELIDDLAKADVTATVVQPASAK